MTKIYHIIIYKQYLLSYCFFGFNFFMIYDVLGNRKIASF